jgi:hypothetical protein
MLESKLQLVIKEQVKSFRDSLLYLWTNDQIVK